MDAENRTWALARAADALDCLTLSSSSPRILNSSPGDSDAVDDGEDGRSRGAGRRGDWLSEQCSPLSSSPGTEEVTLVSHGCSWVWWFMPGELLRA